MSEAAVLQINNCHQDSDAQHRKTRSAAPLPNSLLRKPVPLFIEVKFANEYGLKA